jgi:hypothetical protein
LGEKYGRVTFALKGVNDGGEFGLLGSFGFAPASKLAGDPDALRMTARILHSKATGTALPQAFVDSLVSLKHQNSKEEEARERKS